MGKREGDIPFHVYRVPLTLHHIPLLRLPGRLFKWQLRRTDPGAAFPIMLDQNGKDAEVLSFGQGVVSPSLPLSTLSSMSGTRHLPGVRRDPSSKSFFNIASVVDAKREEEGGEKIKGESEFSSLPNPPLFSPPRPLLLTLATVALFTIHSQHKARIEKY